jgi:RND family efflux transporter MFP subunit
MTNNRLRMWTLASLGILALAGSPARAAEPQSGRYPGITVPSKRHQMSLKVPDVVREVHVKAGDVVKKGQLLLSEDTREEEINLKIIKSEADSDVVLKAADVAIKAAEVTKKNREVELGRVKQMYTDKVAGISELNKAELDVELAGLEIEKAKLDLEKAKIELNQRKFQADRQAVLIERMRINAEFDGEVEEILVKEGEVLDPQKPAIVVVKLDPLWVEVHLPVEITANLKVGQELEVLYGGQDKARKAKVFYLNPVADAGAGTQQVRMELPNPENRRAGMQVQVNVGQPAGVAAKN